MRRAQDEEEAKEFVMATKRLKSNKTATALLRVSHFNKPYFGNQNTKCYSNF
jgi:hypothetical protein